MLVAGGRGGLGVAEIRSTHSSLKLGPGALSQGLGHHATTTNPTSTPKSSPSGLFSSPLVISKPPTPVWEAEKEDKAQGNFSPGQGFLRASPRWSLQKPRFPRADGENLFSLLETEAGLTWVDREVLGRGQGSHPLCDPS